VARRPESTVVEAHRIHLRGPWECEPLRSAEFAESGDPAPSDAVRVTMPAPWREIHGDRRGRARFRRKFHRPTNLDPDERLFLVFEGVRGRAVVDLDDRRLGEIAGGSPSVEFEVTRLVRPNSELVLDVEYDPALDEATPPTTLWRTVALEIR
jgi:hypothetical protein